MKKMCAGLGFVCTVALTLSAAAEAWPFAILRSYGSYESNRDFLGRVFAAQERHPGLFEEIWFSGIKGDIFGDPDQMGAGAAEINLAAKPICEKLGIAFSYQQGVTLNHEPDDQPHAGIPDDAWIVDRSGRVRKGVFCSTSPFALDFSYRKAKSIMAALRPESYWPDDDLRNIKADWGKAGNCFCPRCLALFGRRMGKTYTRESLLAELDVGPQAKAGTREAWCAFNAETLAAYAQTFRRAADEVSPETRLGIQAACSRFTANGDLMKLILESFAGADGKAGIRPGGGYYSDLDGRDGLIDKMVDVARDAARAGAMLRKGQICYECENWPHVGAIKNPGSMMAECALALAFGCDSIAFYWGADQNGEASENYDFWLETVHRWRPFHLAVRDAFRDTSLGGVAVCHGSGHFATDEWYSHVDDRLTRLARNALPVTVTEAQPDALIVNERSVRTLTTNDLAKVFARPTLMDAAAFEALGKRFPGLKFAHKLKVEPLAGERALSTSVRASGYEKFANRGKCEKVRALLHPQAEDVVRFSEMTADPKACGTCVVPTEFGGKVVVAQDIDGNWPHVCWPGCRRHAILDALDAAVPGGMPARLLTDGYALAMTVRKDAAGRTAGVLLMNFGLGETPPLELAIRRGVGDAWQVMLPKGKPSPAEIVRRSADETVVRLPPLQAYQPILVKVDRPSPLDDELRKSVSRTAVPLRPFTVRTAKDVEVKDLFRITFGTEAVTAEVPLPTCALKIPYAALKEKGGEATLDYDGVKWTLLYGDQRDVDFVKRPVVVADNAAVAAFPKQDLPAQPDAKPVAGSIQYWTPHDWNAWVGDCAAIRWGGRIHVFYLYDRRHHRSKAGGGGHYFAHISSEDLVHWTEHPDAVPPTRRWEYIGTGMPIDIGGKLHLFYGLHTDRYGRGWEKFPVGGTYAVSSDGIHFSKSDDIFMDDQNPSPFIRDDGRLGIVHSFCSTNAGEWVAGTLKGPWTKLHDTIPTGGDCPFHFTWNGWRYVIQGFIGMAASQTGASGTWADWVMSGDDIYDGLSVPVVSAFGENRRILVGWIRHPDGWGGWLCFRELVQHADGKLGTKWADEIPPPEKPRVLDIAAGEPFARRFVRTDGEADELEFSVDPKTARVQFANVVGGKVPRIATLSERAQAATGETFRARYLKRYADSPDQCNETAIGKVRGLDRPYRVRLAVHYDPKGDATIFDAEVAGGRTLLCMRRGKWQAAEW